MVIAFHILNQNEIKIQKDKQMLPLYYSIKVTLVLTWLTDSSSIMSILFGSTIIMLLILFNFYQKCISTEQEDKVLKQFNTTGASRQWQKDQAKKNQ